MINTLTRARMHGPLLAAAITAIAAPALAQAPTQAQRDAIKSQCRSDYMAHCSSVPPGGEASLQCLQKNMSSLSSSCQGAVRAVAAPAAAKPADTAAPKAAAPAATAPAAATTAPAKSAEPKAAAAAPAAGQPTNAQISAIRGACRSDYPKVCAGVPTGGAPALQCLEKNKGKLSAGCEKAVAAATGGATAAPAAGAAPAAAAPAAAGAAPAAAAAPTVIVLRPMRPREELFVLRSACGADVRSICGTVTPGGGRIVQCLATNAAQLSPACKDVLSQFAAR
ncbi:hypothetical protein [Bradyrhizobium paxllaeri]|uniref:hypothetical protein n=1 Tax=Bradyrhizobium paxllaeri TaxID=190148 RepID=UPI000810D8BE|nr:hypothetical protein [Bradyrhizobium paxllaeri]